jgi:uncharacterized membrane protein
MSPLHLLLILAILLVLDAIYIGPQYFYLSKVYSTIQNSPLKINWIGGVLCYLFLTFVLYYFILSKKNSLSKKVLDAFLLGICIYGVYETTSYATLTKWPVRMLIVDTLWGGVLFALTTIIYSRII